MNIYFKCSNCKHENRFKTDARTRVEFAMKNGKTNELKCSSCDQTNFLKVNKLYAKQSKSISLLSGFIFLIGSAVGVYFVMEMISEMKTVIGIFVIACGLLIPVWIYSILNQEDRSRVKTFNQTYVTD